MASQKYARAGDNVAPDATPTLTSGSVAAGSALANVVDRNPAKALRLAGTSGTIRFTFGAGVELVGIAIVNHNLVGATVTLTNNGGGGGISGQAIAIAANGLDAQCTNAILDFTLLYSATQRTATQWDVAISGAALGNVAIGEILLLTAIRDLRWMWGVTVRPTRAIVTPGTTFGESHLRYNKRIRRRRFSGKLQLQSEEAGMRLLEEEAQGEYFAWLLWPDIAVNDCWLVQFEPGSFQWAGRSIGSTEIPIEGSEVSSGPPLFP